MKQHKTLSLRDMHLVCELAGVLKTLRPLKDAERELVPKGYRVASLCKEIKRLEQSMGESPGSLVRATPNKGSVITARGLSIAQAFKEMLAIYKRNVQSAVPDRRGLVTVGMTNSAASHLLSTVIADSEFSRKWPDTDLEVLEGYADDLQHHLLQFDVDFCVAPKMAARPGVVRETLSRGVASWYFARMYPNSRIWPPVATSRMNGCARIRFWSASRKSRSSFP